MHVVGHSVADHDGILILKHALEEIVKFGERRLVGKNAARIRHHFFRHVPVKAVARIDQHVTLVLKNIKILIGNAVTKTEDLGAIIVAVGTFNVKKQILHFHLSIVCIHIRKRARLFKKHYFLLYNMKPLLSR